MNGKIYFHALTPTFFSMPNSIVQYHKKQKTPTGTIQSDKDRLEPWVSVLHINKSMLLPQKYKSLFARQTN